MIYLDHNATSPLRPAVQEAMAPWWGVPANPASAHRAGQRAAIAVEAAREAVAALTGTDPAGIVFTSGATEANHLFLRGAVQRRPGAVITSDLEHACVVAALAALADQGTEVRRWGVGPDGVLEVGAIGRDVSLITCILAHHETGVIQPAWDLAARVAGTGVQLHVDATQAAGRVPLQGLEAQGLTLSAHKLGGPPGIGALALPDGDPFPAMMGGSQERGRRGGTVPTALAVGFGAACTEARLALEARTARWRSLQAHLEAALAGMGARVVGQGASRVPSTTCVVFPGLRGESVVQSLDLQGVCVSAGAACASGSLEPSAALVAMGEPEPSGAVRISLGADTSQEDIGGLLAALPGVLGGLRLAADWEA